MTKAGEAVDDLDGVRSEDGHHRRLRLRPHHAGRAQRPVPVRRARPGAVLVPVGPAVRRHARRGRPRRHPPPRRLLVRHRPPGAPRHAVRRGLQRLRRPRAHRGPDPRGARPAARGAAGRLRRPVPRVQQDRPDHPRRAHISHACRRQPERLITVTVTPAPSAPVPLGGPRFQTEPNELYRDMRRDHGAVAPVVLDGDVPAWLVLGYRELHQVTSDPVLFSPRLRPVEPVGPHPRRLAAAADDRPQAAVDPVHRRRAPPRARRDDLRRPGGRRPLRTAQPRRAVRGRADRRALRRGRARDIVGEYAMLLPVRVLARLYGFARRAGPRRWSPP